MDKGFPRPKVYVETTYNDQTYKTYGDKWNDRVYPVPYTARDEEHIAEFSESRGKECAVDKVCSVCGEYVEDDLVGVAVLNENTQNAMYRDYVKVFGWITTEAGPFHLKCLSIAFTLCPHLVVNDIFEPAVGLWEDIKPLMMEWYEDVQ